MNTLKNQRPNQTIRQQQPTRKTFEEHEPHHPFAASRPKHTQVLLIKVLFYFIKKIYKERSPGRREQKVERTKAIIV